MTDYCSESDVEEWLGPVATPDLAPLIASCVSAASRWVEGYCGGRQFSLDDTASDRYYDVASDGSVLTDDIGDPTVTLATGDSTGVYTATTDFQLLPLNATARNRPFWQIRPTVTGFPWPSITRTGLVKVTAQWGWPAIPDDVRQATILRSAWLLNRRVSPGGVQGFNDFGPVRLAGADKDVESLLEPYRLICVA